MTSKKVKQQVAIKIILEEQLKPKLHEFFSHVNKDVHIIYKASGKVPDLQQYNSELAGILRTHYRKVSDKFSHFLRDELDGKSLRKDLTDEGDDPEVEKERSKLDDAILLALLLWISKHSITQSQLILETTQRQFNDIVTLAITNLSSQGIPASRSEVADAVQSTFNDLIDGKIDLVATTETQQPSEQSKLIEATAMLAALALLGSAANMMGLKDKMWNTILDGKERLHHHMADGQVVPIDKPFTVNGEQLMVPGDTSLGAGPANICNCRCTATYQ